MTHESICNKQVPTADSLDRVVERRSDRHAGNGPDSLGNSMIVSCVRTRGEFDALRPEWDNLVGRTAATTLFQSHRWCATWLSTLGRDGQPYILVARDPSGRLVGIAPLWSTGRQGKALRFIGDYHSEYNDFIVDQDVPDAMPALMGGLLQRRRDWRTIVLAHLLDDAVVGDAMPGYVGKRGLACRTYPFGEAPTCLFKDPEHARKTANKRNLRNYLNRLQRESDVRFLHLRRVEEIEPYRCMFYDMHVQRWADSETPSQFNDNEVRTFYDQTIQTLAPHGQVLLSTMLVDGQPVAFQFAFLDGGRLIGNCMCYDQAFAAFSPSLLLMRSTFEHAGELGLTEYDFGGGNEGYKFRFTNHVRKLSEIRVARSSVHAWVDHRAQLLRQRLRDSGKAKSFIKSLLTKLPG